MQVIAIVYTGRIVNRAQAFEWHQFQWPRVTSNPDFKVTILFNECYLWQSWEDSLWGSYSPVSEEQMPAHSSIWARVLLIAQSRSIHSLDFVVMRFLMKLFRTANKDIIDDCRSFCNFPLPTEMLEIKSNKFCKKIKCNKSMLRYFNISVS